MSSTKGEKDLHRKITPFLVIASIVLAFAVGVLWQKVSTLEGEPKSTLSADEPADFPNAFEEPTQGKLTQEQTDRIPPVVAGEHIRGSENPSVYLIEYSDYECPYCSNFHLTAKRVIEEYPEVAWVYRHFPLDQLHQTARLAAEASECITEIGGNDAFWAFSDLIYEDQSRANDLVSLALEVGVDESSFNSCLESGRYADMVEDQYQRGIDTGIRGTPGNIILNNKGEAWLVPGAYPFDQLKVMIEEALGV